MNRTYYWHDKNEIEHNKRKYVIETIEEYNQLYQCIKADKNWFSKFLKLCHHYYQQEPSGGNLHIVLDDGNLEDGYVSWCAGLCSGMQDHEGMDLAHLLESMTLKQRERVYKNYNKFRYLSL